MDNTDFAALARQDNLGSLTVPQLKGFLAHRGLSTVGKKVDLLARVKEALWTKGEKEL